MIRLALLNSLNTTQGVPYDSARKRSISDIIHVPGCYNTKMQYKTYYRADWQDGYRSMQELQNKIPNRNEQFNAHLQDNQMKRKGQGRDLNPGRGIHSPLG